ncbi:Nicastrin [Nesidiocoris tenuis]|uniref:Nicastrin n=1 Tax=Nesidiocoris tenuis TaxID=355587 RepID=A0ABN7AP21_9HEMI|nr:Nicastrin [Nesidiocoris tenuis]
MSFSRLIILFGLSLLVDFVEPVRHDVNEMIYVPILGSSACFRRLNGTHQFGCSSPPRGSNGVIHVIYDSTNLDEFIDKAVAGPYILLLPPLMFTRTVTDRLIASGKVDGIVLAWASSAKPEHYSPDDVCPNRNGGYCDAESPWNPEGHGFIVSNMPFPVFLIQDPSYLDNITKCFKDYNLPLDGSQLSKPLCMLQLKAHMYAAVNSEVCIRRRMSQLMTVFKYCDPLGNENIIYPMVNLSAAEDKKLIAVVARLDGFSIFDGLGPGAMSAVSSTATLIVLANILHDLMPVISEHKMYKGIVFMLLNGESFDYIGSQRVVYDMEKGTFITDKNKIKIEDIELVIELTQLGPGKTFYLHRTNDAKSAEVVDSLVQISKNLSLNFLKSSLPAGRLPPVSLTVFREASPNISGVVVANYDSQFNNRYYNGLLDDGSNLNLESYTSGSIPPKNSTQTNLAGVAISLARAIARLVNKDDSIEYQIVQSRYVETMDEVLRCLAVSRKCNLFKKLYPNIATNAPLPEVLSVYVGISTSISSITRATWKMLAYLSTDTMNSTQDQCNSRCADDDELVCFWVKEENGDGTCVLSPIQLHQAVSPAFEIEDYDWASGKYSTWTESVWADMGVQMFIRGTSQRDAIVFGSGIVVLVFSVIGAFLVNKKSDSLFAVKTRPENC